MSFLVHRHTERATSYTRKGNPELGCGQKWTRPADRCGLQAPESFCLRRTIVILSHSRALSPRSERDQGLEGRLFVWFTSSGRRLYRVLE